MSLGLKIIGAGPAGLAAAIYAARAGIETTIYEKGIIGGALNDIPKIENYPGFTGPGAELAKIMKNQATAAGAKFSDDWETDDLLSQPKDSDVILIATGSEPIPLDFETNAPVSYCALCDGPLYQGKHIAVVGGGNSAVSESIYLANLAKSVTLFSRSQLKAEKCLIDKLSTRKNITIHENTEVNAAKLDDFAAVFVFIGKRPATSFLPKSILDQDGFIKTKGHQTTIPRIFAAGDVRAGSIRQAITAAGDGAAAAIKIIDFLKEM